MGSIPCAHVVPSKEEVNPRAAPAASHQDYRASLGQMPAQNTDKCGSPSILHENAFSAPQISTVLLQIFPVVVILNSHPANPPKHLWKWYRGLSGQWSTILYLPKHLFTNSTISLVKVTVSNSYAISKGALENTHFTRNIKQKKKIFMFWPLLF